MKPWEPGSMFDPAMLDGNWRLLVGSEGDEPVATAAAYLAPTLNLVEFVSARAEVRSRGFGAALTAAAGVAAPDRPAMLIASDLGRSVYDPSATSRSSATRSGSAIVERSGFTAASALDRISRQAGSRKMHDGCVTDLVDLFQRAVDGFGRHVRAVAGSQWHDPTPCTEWDVRMLVNHVTVEQMWVPPLVGGVTVAEVGSRLDGDQLGDDPRATWDDAALASLEAFRAPGALEGVVWLSGGDAPSADYCWEMTTDALIHSWDLARGIGADETLDPELVGVVYERIVPVADKLQDSGMFAAPVEVPDHAPLQTKLLGLFGRRA
jgi:uncharacterized protein (TIGR03086 family)